MKSTHEGILDINGVALSVAILEGGTRIIAQSAVFKALGRNSRGNSRVIGIPAFMDAKNLQPFINEDLRHVIKKVEFTSISGKAESGFDANILPLVSDLYLKAREAGAITMPSQLETAQKAEILVRSLAKVGITALVDEATGYQYDREKDALQTILQAYISNEVAKWQLTFTVDFYKELFRLWGQPFNPQSIRKPQFVGRLTNLYIYKPLHDGVVLDEIKSKTPRDNKGNYKYKFHQNLTDDVGREHLKRQIIEVTALMSVCDSKEQFKQMFDKKYGSQGTLPLDDANSLG